MRVAAFHDLDLPASSRAHHSCSLCARIPSIGVDALDEAKAGTGLLQQVIGRVPVLYVYGKHDDVQQKAERVDEDVAFATRDLFARVIALRVNFRTPF